MLQRLNENKDLIIVAIASFFIGFGVASLFGGDANKGLATDPVKTEMKDTTLPPLPFNEETVGKGPQVPAKNEGAMMVPSGTNSLTAENQRAGGTVLVKKGEFSEARWVVVREKNDVGSAGNILGAGWFPAGVHENVSVPLLRATVGGEQYVVELFADTNGDKQFDHKTDQQISGVTASFSTVASASGE